MKKLLLFIMAIFLGGIVISQQTHQFKINAKEKSVIKNKERGIEPIKSPVLTKSSKITQSIKPDSDRNTNIVSIVPLGTSANIYGWGYSGGQEALIPLNQDINTIAVIHRMGGDDDIDGYSGDLGYDVSFDAGMTWSTMNEFYIATENNGGEYYVDAARYPNAGIFDPTGNYANSDDAYLSYFAALLWGTNDIWGAYGSGVVNFGDTSIHTKTMHSELDYATGVPSAYFMTKEGVSMSVDQDFDLVTETYNDLLIVARGIWDDNAQDLIYTFTELDAPMDVSEYPYDEKIAFAPDGMTGYISVIGNNGNADQYGGVSNVYPIFWKTTDGGESWSDASFIQLDGPNGIGGIVNHHLTDELIADLFDAPVPDRDDISYTTAFDHDIAVDKNGNLHIAVVIGPTGSDPQTIIYSEGYLAAIDLFTTDGGSTWLAEEMGRVKTMRGDFNDISEDNRIRITTDWLGEKIFISWLDTDIEDAEDNDKPNIWCRGFNPANYMKTASNGVEDAPTNVTLFSEGMWQSYFGNAAKYCFTNDNGYNIPFVYEEMDPTDILAPVRFKYIQDFYFTDADFNIQGVEDNYITNKTVKISQNFPNPFKKESFVSLSLGGDTHVSMEIFSITGKLMKSKDYGLLLHGNHTLTIDATDLSSGVYFYSVNAGEKKLTKKMIIE
jgi:hypothetical protein